MENVLVIGAARSGIAASKLLLKEDYHPVLTDMKEIPEKEELEKMGIEVYDKGHPDLLKEKDYAFIVKNPGIPYHAPLIAYYKDKLPIYTEIETAYLAAPNLHYGAVTGTDGKTTVTTLLHEMLKKKDPDARAAGNIGTPLSEVVLTSGNEDKLVALELSNFQLLGTEKFHPEVSVVTNLAPDHLDYMDSLEDYYSSKMKIYANTNENDWFILNTDDPEVMKYAVNIPAKVVTFSVEHPADLYTDGKKAYLFGEELFDVKDLKIVGKFNLGNAMMAAAMAYKLGVSKEDIQIVIRNFHGVEHRIEYLGELNGVKIYNDSKATNTHAACAALSAFDKNVLLLCGGKDKHISFDDLHKYDSVVKKAFTFGQTKDKLKAVFTNSEAVETMEEALDGALAEAKAGDTILLSPACSSFDQFVNYEKRGEIFKDLVKVRMNKGE